MIGQWLNWKRLILEFIDIESCRSFALKSFPSSELMDISWVSLLDLVESIAQHIVHLSLFLLTVCDLPSGTIILFNYFIITYRFLLIFLLLLKPLVILFDFSLTFCDLTRPDCIVVSSQFGVDEYFKSAWWSLWPHLIVVVACISSRSSQGSLRLLVKLCLEPSKR